MTIGTTGTQPNISSPMRLTFRRTQQSGMADYRRIRNKNIKKLSHGILHNENIHRDTSNLDALGAELIALKVAIGLLFQKMPDHIRTAFLEELRQLNNPWMSGLAGEMEKIKI